ncbi:MAG TPA: pyruvate ferredoxin oxidoreductase, partial [Chloroflexota bacterium]|nr:pyruvate ferredoxin oxidoreductase [Chloroflexota bacterium]
MAIAEPNIDRRKIKTVRISGCTASALAAKYADVDVVTAFPIRPYTAIMMQLSQMVANGELDAEFVHSDGEHAQLSIAHGAASSGARVFTGSSGVGVTYAYETYSIISGSRVPVQMAIADRTLDPPGDFGSEHTDALCTRDMGWLMGWCESPQEVLDKHLMAFRIGEDHRVLLPQMVCQDGYFVSHISGDVDLPDQSLVDEFLPPYKLPFALDPNKPVSHGPQIMPEQGPALQLGRAAAMEGAVPVIREVTDQFGEMFGRKYAHFVELYKCDDADAVFFMQGAHSVTARAAVDEARERGMKLGVARLLWVRPFPTEDVQQLLAHVKAIGVVETNLALGGASSGGALMLDLCTALYPLRQRPLTLSFMAGMGGETIPMHEFEWMC